MILLTRLSGRPFTLNADLIERIDSTPDTVITLVDGKKYVVAQTAHEVREAVLAYRSRIFADSGLLGSADEDGAEGPDGPTRAARRA